MLASVVVSAAFAGLTTAMGWWRETGYRAPHSRRSLLILWLPALVLASLYGGWRVTGATDLLLLVVAAFLTGFLEETIFRGLILRAFLPGGTKRAVIASSILFSLFHLMNLIGGAPLGITLIQLGIALTTAVFMAALTLRTGSIWPAILYHTVHDLLIWLGQGGIEMPTEPSTTWKIIMLSGQAVLFIYGIVLLRGVRSEGSAK